MREDILNWLKQAKEDLDSAKKNLQIKKYYLVAFLSQQSCEKGLKALLMLKTKRRIFETHSLVELGRQAGVPEEILYELRRLAPEYIISRYPDATESVPYENYDESIAKDRLNRAEKFFKWLNSQIK